MGDQLARGWADTHAKAQERYALNQAQFNESQQQMFEAQQRRLMREYLAEEGAEEATLP